MQLEINSIKIKKVDVQQTTYVRIKTCLGLSYKRNLGEEKNHNIVISFAIVMQL